MPPEQQAQLRQLLAEGAGLAQKRDKWRLEVRRIKVETSRLHMPAPGFGCKNPALIHSASVAQRSDVNSLFYDPDCEAESQGLKPLAYGPAPDSVVKARANVAAQIANLKAQDPQLSAAEIQHARRLAQIAATAVQSMRQTPAATLTWDALAGIEALRLKVLPACIAQQGRGDSETESLLQRQASELAPVYDRVLAQRTPEVERVLRAASSGAQLRNEIQRLFPSPLLLERAQAQAALARLMEAEGARVAALDAVAKRDREAKSAERARQAREASPEYLELKRLQKNMQTNAKPTANDLLGAVTDAVIFERNGRREKGMVHREEHDQLMARVNFPIFGTVVLYHAAISLEDWQCQPKGKLQSCVLSYKETPMVVKNSDYSPPASINRRHTATFHWTEDGLKSADLGASVWEAHAKWHEKIDAALTRRKAVQDAMETKQQTCVTYGNGYKYCK